MKAQRVLLLVTQADWGGVQAFLLHFAEDLIREGRTVLLAGGGEGEMWERAAAKGIPTHRLTHMARDINPLEDLRGIKELRKLIQSWKPDAIDLNSSKMGILGSIACIGMRARPHIAYRIGGWAFLEPIGALKQTIYLMAEILTAPLKDIIVTVHPGDEALARRKWIRPRKKLVTVPNGLDVPSFVSQLLPKAVARERLGIPMHAFVYGTIGKAYATKGLIPYIHTLGRVLQKDAHTYAVIISDGLEFPEMQRARASLDVKDRILLPGALHGPELYSAFDVFVLPSRKEGMPWTILEAMAARLPVIATDVGGCRWMLEGADGLRAGIVVPPQNPQALERAMDTMRTHAAEREAYARSAWTIGCQRFSWTATYQGNRDTLDQ